MYGFEGTGYVWFGGYRVRMASSVQDAWLRVYGVPGFESTRYIVTGYRGMGYIASRVLRYRVRGT